MSIWVVNTSPLVFLGNLGRLELLRHEGREVYIPQAVAEEITEKPDAAAQAVQAACGTWMQVRNVTDQTAVMLVQAALHKGEAEAIVLAAELHAERLVLDDQDARRFADRCGLKVMWPQGHWYPGNFTGRQTARSYCFAASRDQRPCRSGISCQSTACHCRITKCKGVVLIHTAAQERQ
jgi:predicted nucleic acid-binding protein